MQARQVQALKARVAQTLTKFDAAREARAADVEQERAELHTYIGLVTRLCVECGVAHLAVECAPVDAPCSTCARPTSAPRQTHIPFIRGAVLALALVGACDGSPGAPDAVLADAGEQFDDAGVVEDAGTVDDAGTVEDAGSVDRCEARQALWCLLDCIGTIPLYPECDDVHCDCGDEP